MKQNIKVEHSSQQKQTNLDKFFEVFDINNDVVNPQIFYRKSFLQFIASAIFLLFSFASFATKSYLLSCFYLFIVFCCFIAACLFEKNLKDFCHFYEDKKLKSQLTKLYQINKLSKKHNIASSLIDYFNEQLSIYKSFNSKILKEKHFSQVVIDENVIEKEHQSIVNQVYQETLNQNK